MTRRVPHFFLMAIAAFFALLRDTPTEAGLVPYHAYVTAYSTTTFALPASQQLLGVVSAATTGNNYVSSSDPRFLSATSAARATLDASNLLGVSATASAQSISQGIQPGNSGIGNAHAYWSDVVFVDGPNRPSAVDITFNLQGQIAAGSSTLAPGTASSAEINVGFASQIYDFSSQYPFPIPPGYPNAFGINANIEAFGDQNGTFFSYNRTAGVVADTLTADQYGQVGGQVTFQANYDPRLGGYGFTIDLWSHAGASNAASAADFLDTLGLTSVTAPDGSALAVHFDSGLTLAAVPEPSSLAMVCVGLLGAAGWARRRRGRDR